MIRVGMGREAADVQALLRGLPSDADGAVLVFLGVVRNQSEGREVSGLEYEAYEEMGKEVLEEIAAEAAGRFASDRILIHHRVGALSVGEISTVIAVATPHRGEAYGASRYIIEEIKKRLPVWKKERYLDGDEAWVKGHVPGADPEAGGEGVEGGGDRPGEGRG